jgi:acyl carrier protein
MYLEEQIISFVAKETGIRLSNVKPETTLFGDIGIDGDDGLELLGAFERYFTVDMSPCRLERHFGPEGLSPWSPFYWTVFIWRTITERDSTSESRARLIPIRVQDLIDSARIGRWTISYEKIT